MNQSQMLHDFPVLTQGENGKKLVYLDNAATTQRPIEVLDAVKNFYETENANPYMSWRQKRQRLMNMPEIR